MELVHHASKYRGGVRCFLLLMFAHVGLCLVLVALALGSEGPGSIPGLVI